MAINSKNLNNLTEKNLSVLLSKLDQDWKIKNKKILTREFVFKNFKEALEFINQVGKIAEQENHHPDIKLFEYKKVMIYLTSHSIDNLSEIDFLLASKIDSLKV